MHYINIHTDSPIFCGKEMKHIPTSYISQFDIIHIIDL